jgi:hypothetical protein
MPWQQVQSTAAAAPTDGLLRPGNLLGAAQSDASSDQPGVDDARSGVDTPAPPSASSKPKSTGVKRDLRGLQPVEEGLAPKRVRRATERAAGA